MNKELSKVIINEVTLKTGYLIWPPGKNVWLTRRQESKCNLWGRKM